MLPASTRTRSLLRSRPIRLLLATLATVALGVSCGARSGLPAPEPLGLGGGGEGGIACVPGVIPLVKAQPTLLFVLDRSGSMGKKLGKGAGSRWTTLRSALASTLPSVSDTMAVGALLFPSIGQPSNGQNCSVPAGPDLAPGTGHVPLLLALMQVAKPGGATPTALAVDAAAAQLAGVRAATDARALVLCTDGGPDCNSDLDSSTCRCVSGGNSCKGKNARCLDDARTNERITAALGAGMPTYVIGIQDEGDDTLTDVLDAMADAGGRPKQDGGQRYYAARSEGELSTALAVIRDQVGACIYLTTSVPDPKGSITVQRGDAIIPFDPGGTEGWRWADQANGEIVLAGQVCAAASVVGSPTLHAQVACTSP